MANRFKAPSLGDRVRTPLGYVGLITEMSFSRDGVFARVGVTGARWWRLSELTTPTNKDGER